MVDHLRNPTEVAPDLLDGIGAFLETPTSPAACAGNNVDMEVFLSSFLEEEMEAIGSYGAAFQPQEQTTVSIAYPTHNYPVCAQPHIAAKEMISENMRSSNLTSQVEARLEWYGSRSSYLAVPTCSNLASSQPMSTIPETRPTVPQSMSTIPEIGPTVSQPMSTIPETGPTVPQPMSINPRPTVPQPMSTLPDTGPTIMTIKAKYRDSTIKFKLPLTSTLAELNEKVEMRLNLKPGSFDVEYKDDDQDDWNEGWITIACDEDLRDYLQLFSSLDNPVIKLLVLDKVVNANESSGSLKRKRL
ncbi:hypothetical protein Vadar_027397 [Vaccinium darrowii]|uniref:Uncharacterized protein n=1 Tax=Vaccinium darrowii TaxID=229202 RepID=A0ACB7YGW9_9ERIC|nr:hypothetical protein Vadar_027397 [Vaccinium darrowii]